MAEHCLGLNPFLVVQRKRLWKSLFFQSLFCLKSFFFPLTTATHRYLLNKHESYNGSSDEDLAYKMLTWAWHMDKRARNGMTNQQFAKYGLIQLGRGADLTRIVKGGQPRRIASKEEVLALKPDLRPPL